MSTCDQCGQETRTLYPYLRKAAMSVNEMETRPLPRLALAALNPEAEAALPWGAHPDDNSFGVLCHPCHSAITRRRQEP